MLHIIFISLTFQLFLLFCILERYWYIGPFLKYLAPKNGLQGPLQHSSRNFQLGHCFHDYVHTQTSCVFPLNDNRTVTLRCNKIFLQIHFRQSSFVYISQVIFYTFDKVFVLFNKWFKVQKDFYCDFFACLAALRP